MKKPSSPPLKGIMSSETIWKIKSNTCHITGEVDLPVSKSVVNRLQIIHYISGFNPIEPAGDYPDDVNELSQILSKLKQGEKVIYAGNGGTSYRFSTAAAALQEQSVTLIAGEQMEKRPIADLIEPLRDLGAEITYLKKEGFPPVKIKGPLSGGVTKVNTANSSQFAGALALAAAGCKKPVTLKLSSHITSRPYFDMTLSMMQSCGAVFTFKNNELKIQPELYDKPGDHLIEKDLSAASYFYEMAALSDSAKITLKNAGDSVLQGDKKAAEYFEFFGVNTKKAGRDLVIIKQPADKPKKNYFEANLNSTPDLAQTLACTAAGVGIDCKLTGLHTLKIKETDRIKALESELEKLGCRVTAGNDYIQIAAPRQLKRKVRINSFDDHRMVMAFAPLVLKTGEIEIENYSSISKSYPRYKKHFKTLTAV